MKHHLSFLCLFVLSVAAFRQPLASLLRASLQDDRYSHVFFILLITVCLVYSRRKPIFLAPRFCLSLGAPLLVLGLLLFRASHRLVSSSDQNDRLSSAALSLVCVWLGGFILCYGTKALGAARFPLSFLLLMIPMPTLLLDPTVGALQRASADVTHALFRFAGVPVDWLGLGFTLRGSHFEIAKECSGIHSTLILFVVSILAGHLFLRSIAAKVCFSVFTVVVAIVKNAVRIVTIAGLTVYVDGSFYDSWLHRKGGVVFAAFALTILVPSLLALRKAGSYSRQEHPTLAAKEVGAVELPADYLSQRNEVAGIAP
jgi:exosortase